jgi:hypothetical protein
VAGFRRVLGRGRGGSFVRLYAPDATVLKQRVEEMARGVCDDDPRTLGERRTDAMTPMAAGIHELACQCGGSACPAAHRDATPPATAVIHVVAQADTVEAARTQGGAGTPPPDSAPTAEHDDDDRAVTAEPDVDDPTSAEELEVDTAPRPALCPAPPAFVIGAVVMPAPLLAATWERATVREVRHPGDAPPEPRYTPSRALADIVRCRDLTCRFPGCDRPADVCDLDHTVPYPIGCTHASNMKCLCRFHHLLKRSGPA